jgi:hypothetical protein
MLFLGVLLANDLLETPIPEEILARGHNDPLVESLAMRVAKSLFHEPDESDRIFGFYVNLLQ